MHAAMSPIPPAVARLLARLGFAPAPDSAVADCLRRGVSPWTEGVHLLWSLWVFITPMLGGQYTWTWALFTALSYPVFLSLYAKVMLVSRRKSYRYALAMAALC